MMGVTRPPPATRPRQPKHRRPRPSRPIRPRPSRPILPIPTLRSAFPIRPPRWSLGDPYDFFGGTPDPALVPAEPGTVEALWYRAGAVYAVVFAGLDAGVAACPGNSVLTAGGFEFVSNAELPNASCPDFPTLIESNAGQGVQLCDGQVGYLTLIPSDTTGTLFASVEAPGPGGGGAGITSSVDVPDPSALPEIDPAVIAC